MEQLKNLRKLAAFGSGVGIEVGAANLEIAAARVRAARIRVLGRITIANYAARPAAEWGAEYTAFLKSLGLGYLSATVLLPRHDVIVRQLALPGVAPKDMESAIRFQLDNLHPYGEDDIVWGWSRLQYGAVLVGIARRADVERYIALFTEAGIGVSSFTFSAAAVHAALRLDGFQRGAGFLALSRSESGAVEAYGESEARPVFSAEFEMAPERAAALSLSELRLPPETEPLPLERVLPKPDVNPVENDLSRNALPYATALAGACPRLAPSANVLPPEHRRFSSRAALIPTLMLAGLLVVAGGAMAAWSGISNRQYLKRIHAEDARLEPVAMRAASLDRELERVRARARLLDQVRSQTRHDLDALSELTKLVEPPAWTNTVELTRDAARISGEVPQVAPLAKILNSSQIFHNIEIVSDARNANGNGETFAIRMNREAGK